MGLKIFVLVLCLILSKGDALKCYSCFAEKGHSSPCEDLSIDKEKVKTEECSAGEICVKYSTEPPGLGHSLIKRSCGSKDICDNIHSMEQGKVLDCKTCSTDLCDSGNLLRGSVILSLFFLVLTRLIY